MQIGGAPGAEATRLLELLAAAADEHGYSGGALWLTDVAGPAEDIGERLVAQAMPDATFPLSAGPAGDGIIVPSHALILLDRAELSASDAAELHRLLPSCRFVIVQKDPIAAIPAVQLGKLSAHEALALLADVYGRPIDADNAPVAIDIAKMAGMLPGPVRLVGRAAREMQRSFISVRVAFERVDTIVRMFVVDRPADEARILAILACAQVPLTAQQIAYIAGGPAVHGRLARLAASELVRVGDDGLYQLPEHVARHVPLPADTPAVADRIVDVFAKALADSAALLTNRQLFAAETFLRVAFERCEWQRVTKLGLPLAEAFALRRLFGAWGRVLRLAASAASRVNDSATRSAVQHQLGVRALLLGRFGSAAAELQAAARDRGAAGDVAGAAATTALLSLIGDARMSAPRMQSRAKRSSPRVSHDAASRTPFASPASTETAATPAQRHPARVPFSKQLKLVPVKLTRYAVALSALTLAAVALTAFLVRVLSHPALAITQIAPVRSTIAAGESTEICVRANGAAAVEIFPDAVVLPPGGRPCVTVHPVVTTRYIAVATAADGAQVHDQTIVAVDERPAAEPRILTFAAYPARIHAGESARLCYAVTGANLLRMVPRTEELTRLHSCATVTLREPHGYIYRLFATNDNGRSTVRQIRVDVVAAQHASPADPAPPAVAERRPREPAAVAVRTPSPHAPRPPRNVAASDPAQPAGAAKAARSGAEAAGTAALSGEWEIQEANRWDGAMVWHGDLVPSGGSMVLSVHKHRVAGRSATPCEQRTRLQAALSFGIVRTTVPYQEVNCAGARSIGELRVVTFSRDERSFRGSFWRQGIKLGDFDARKL